MKLAPGNTRRQQQTTYTCSSAFQSHVIKCLLFFHLSFLESYQFFFCSTALNSTGWVQMTIKPRHCPPSKQCGCHLISASEKISGAENRTRAGWVGSKYAIHCAMPTPFRGRLCIEGRLYFGIIGTLLTEDGWYS